ncbi:MAG TPA: heavy metal translocating P-type ATPase [Gaiellales bacterium]|jgi:heavy metal translocating P-type ATPase|nr:heavy metal translocating P-type ATPase [Gaiellales bacterium]
MASEHARLAGVGVARGRGRPGWGRRAALWSVVHRARILASLAALSILVGGALYLSGEHAAASDVWAAAVLVLAAELAFEVVRTVIVDHHMGVDTIALVAMVGALALGEEFAGVIIGLMFSGGQTLEDIASTRARRELTSLIQRAPKVAQLRVGDGLEQVPVAQVMAGDVVVVRSGEVVPVDGTVVGGEAVVDTSTLSGEPLPVTIGPGMPVLSGSANAGSPFDVRADRPAAESAYAALVRLVEQAQAHRAPFVRMADRYAGFFLPATLIAAALAWALSGDPVRALAVVVVATPCPLILAAPIALVSGLSRAARCGVIVKGAGAIETLGEARTVLFDKTGTLTVGTPDVRDIVTYRDHQPGELLALAASVDQMSAHVLGDALVRSAVEAGLALVTPTDVHEVPGQGIQGMVDGRTVAVGSRAFMRAAGVREDEISSAAVLPGHGSGEAHVLVCVDGLVGGVIVMADELRPDADRIVERLRAEGILHVAMVSGDRRSVAERVGRELGVDRVYAEQTPEEKLDVVRMLRDDPGLRPVIMVGDGVNDAPALALADIGIAMGVAGATVSSETADAVITVDRIDRVADAVHTGRRSLHIARQSVLAGMGLSIAAMAVAAAGYLTPVAGALFQEAIDLAVILNALRALRG